MDTRLKEEGQAVAEHVAAEEKLREIILHNDDVNTFEHVIVSLMEVCDHDPLQAEQCAWLVHYKGKCSVKRGSFKTLRPLCEALCERGLSADIQ